MKPPKPDPHSRPNGDAHSSVKPTHANRRPMEDDRWVRPVVKNSPKNMEVVTERKEAEEALKESEERFRSQSRELALLHRVRIAIADELKVQSVLSKAVEAIAETYDYTRLGAYLLEDEELVLQHQVGCHEVIGRIPLTKGLCGRAVRTGRPVLGEDVSAAPDSL